jgi:hypothetical protein
MSVPKVDSLVRSCPFCGLVTQVPHETQEGCIAALQSEIGRVRGILTTLKPASRPADDLDDQQPPAKLRVVLD